MMAYVVVIGEARGSLNQDHFILRTRTQKNVAIEAIGAPAWNVLLSQ
jgi:hypothetical protein